MLENVLYGFIFVSYGFQKHVCLFQQKLKFKDYVCHVV